MVGPNRIRCHCGRGRTDVAGVLCGRANGCRGCGHVRGHGHHLVQIRTQSYNYLVVVAGFLMVAAQTTRQERQGTVKTPWHHAKKHQVGVDTVWATQ